MKTGIECINAGKVFITPEGEHEVVRDLSFATKENEFLVLFGPGQCGKTTIINMIAGFEDVTSGQVLADGKKVEKPEPSRGVVFQNIALFPWMTTMTARSTLWTATYCAWSAPRAAAKPRF